MNKPKKELKIRKKEVKRSVHFLGIYVGQAGQVG